jgi:hypothetical protein
VSTGITASVLPAADLVCIFSSLRRRNAAKGPPGYEDGHVRLRDTDRLSNTIV